MDDDGGDDIIFHNECLDMIDRYRRMDELVPSYHNILSTTALNSKLQLIKAGATPLNTIDFLQYTSDGTYDILRLNAFTNMMELGMIKNNAILGWFLCVLSTDPSPYIRENMLHIFGKALGFIAIGETSPAVSVEIAQPDGLIIEQDASTEARKADLARKQTVAGALKALRVEMDNNEVLKEKLWNAISSPTISLRELGQLLDICEMLYTPESSMIVVLKYPRYWKCTKTGRVRSKFTFTSSHPPLRDGLTNNTSPYPYLPDNAPLPKNEPYPHETHASPPRSTPQSSAPTPETQTPSPAPTPDRRIKSPIDHPPTQLKHHNQTTTTTTTISFAPIYQTSQKDINREQHRTYPSFSFGRTLSPIDKRSIVIQWCEWSPAEAEIDAEAEYKRRWGWRRRSWRRCCSVKDTICFCFGG